MKRITGFSLSVVGVVVAYESPLDFRDIHKVTSKKIEMQEANKIAIKAEKKAKEEEKIRSWSEYYA